MVETLPFLVAGFGLGLVHSLDPDHLAAMATLVGRRDQSRIGDLANGALWGLGHTLALGLLGAGLLMADDHSPPWLDRAFEIGVALMLVALGAARLWGVGPGPRRCRPSDDDSKPGHDDPFPRCPRHHGAFQHPRHRHMPVWIGMLHGLAGTGAVLVFAPALIVASLHNYVLYVLSFGLGTILSMSAYCGGLGSLIAGLQVRFSSAAHRFATAPGVLSIGIGVAWLWRAVATW